MVAEASVGVIGASGGGSHVCQQVAHQGFGRIVVIDDQLVEDVQLGRMIGSKPSDVARLHKTAVMRRLISSVDPSIEVEEIRERVPSGATLEAMKSVDIVVCCVDTFRAREQVNAFCRRHGIPLIDIGMGINTDDGRLASAYGQIIVVMPEAPCLRCTPLLSDAVLSLEAAERPIGYDVNPDAEGDPQVVSMNGVLASEAANAALDIVTGYANGGRGAGWWVYDGRRGELSRAALPRRRQDCPACAEEFQGDAFLA
jgi:molybdopterin/thiamine biosynthesis adenylyltransferase